MGANMSRICGGASKRDSKNSQSSGNVPVKEAVDNGVAVPSVEQANSITPVEGAGEPVVPIEEGEALMAETENDASTRKSAPHALEDCLAGSLKDTSLADEATGGEMEAGNDASTRKSGSQALPASERGSLAKVEAPVTGDATIDEAGSAPKSASHTPDEIGQRDSSIKGEATLPTEEASAAKVEETENDASTRKSVPAAPEEIGQRDSSIKGEATLPTEEASAAKVEETENDASTRKSAPAAPEESGQQDSSIKGEATLPTEEASAAKVEETENDAFTLKSAPAAPEESGQLDSSIKGEATLPTGEASAEDETENGVSVRKSASQVLQEIRQRSSANGASDAKPAERTSGSQSLLQRLSKVSDSLRPSLSFNLATYYGLQMESGGPADTDEL